MKTPEFLWAVYEPAAATMHAIDETQVATEQEAICGESPPPGSLWLRADALDDRPRFLRCPWCTRRTSGMKDVSAKVERWVNRHDREDGGPAEPRKAQAETGGWSKSSSRGGIVCFSRKRDAGLAALEPHSDIDVIMAVELPRQAREVQGLGSVAYLVVYMNAHPRPSFSFNKGPVAALMNVLRERFGFFHVPEAESLARQLADLLHSSVPEDQE